MYWEDADWCRRMWQAGWEVVYFPKASVVHHVGVSSKQLIPRTLIEFHKTDLTEVLQTSIVEIHQIYIVFQNIVCLE